MMVAQTLGAPRLWLRAAICLEHVAAVLHGDCENVAPIPCIGPEHRPPRACHAQTTPSATYAVYIYTVSICIHVIHRWCMCIYKHIPPGRTFAQSFMGIHGVFSYVVICSGFISDLFRVCLGLV